MLRFYRLLASAVLASLILIGCVIPAPVMLDGSGVVVTREMDLSGFDQIEISHAFNARVTRGDEFGVVIRIDDNLERYLEVVTVGRVLKIGLRPAVGLTGRHTLEADVTLPELRGLKASGASRVTVSGFASEERLSLDASGASKIDLDLSAGSVKMAVSGASNVNGALSAGDVDINVSGASKVTLTGAGDNARLEASGASRIDLSDFVVTDADVEASGASRVVVNATGIIDVKASGASHIEYLGGARLERVDTSGASSVRAR